MRSGLDKDLCTLKFVKIVLFKQDINLLCTNGARNKIMHGDHHWVHCYHCATVVKLASVFLSFAKHVYQ